jgi:thiamine transporter
LVKEEFSMKVPLKVLVEGALCIALSVALSYVRLFSLPQGGSVSLSMLPLFIFALRRGGGYGVLAGVVTGLLHLFLGGYVVHPVQALLDYPIASGALGLAGFFPRRKPLGLAVGTLASMLSYVLSGVVFFASYAPKGMNVLLYSLLYNGSYALPEGLICAALVYLILPRLEKFR